MEWCRDGITRDVFLISKYAIKIPKLTYGWGSFLQGLLANMQEVRFAASGWPELCPILFALPGGLCVVMPRTEPLDEMGDWKDFNPIAFCQTEDYVIPCEYKWDSFGKLDGRIVAIDYGN